MAMQTAKVRPAAVAGMFYPSSRQALQVALAKLTRNAPGFEGKGVKAIIAPHAGYIYSGQVAASAFGALAQTAHPITRVVVIGPAHYVGFRGIAVPSAHAFETPLGQIPVAQGALAKLTELPFVSINEAAHAPEHALEVELPFLQTLLHRFDLIPLLVGDATPSQVEEVLRMVAGGAETLIVVSSDLSHYYEYEAARRLDAETAESIERYAWNELSSNSACGFLPIAGMLIEGMRRGLKVHRLALCNSGDTAGDCRRVVGYGAWAFSQGANSE
jgi:AmmeMemoRadiSam system protein B